MCITKKTYLAKQSDLIKLLGIMPPKFNIDLEKWWLEDDPSLLGRELFRGYVKFLRGTYFFRLKRQKMRRESSARRFPEHPRKRIFINFSGKLDPDQGSGKFSSQAHWSWQA